MKNNKRSAFTIVELVIVIAVIAILSAVLIPTFGAIIKDANIAADQTAASTLTSELHVFLKGKQITTEEELMAALASKEDDGSGIGEKLVPKALAYGYHFWFDMENQMFIAKTAEEVKELGEQRKAASAHAEVNGPMLVNDIVAQADGGNANISFRDIYGYEIYFVDYSGALANVINTLQSLASKADYESAIGGLKGYEIDEDDLGEDLFTQLKKTVIISNAGSFFYEGATNADVAFVRGFKGSVSKHFVADANDNVTERDAAEKTDSGEVVNKLPTVSGDVVLPEDTSFVGDNSLNFDGTANVVVSDERVEHVFCEEATNATINGQYTIVDDKLMDGDTEVKTLISLDGRFPAYNFAILQQDDLDKNTYAWNNGTLYVNYYAFVDQGSTLVLSLTSDGQTVVPDTMAYVTWVCEGGASVGTLTEDESTIYNVLNVTDNGKATATVTLLDGTEGKFSFDVVVVKPDSATVNMGSHTANVPYTGLGQGFEWYYDGTNGDVTVSIGNAEYPLEFANGTPNIALDYDADVFTFADGKLSLNTDDNGNLTVKKNDDGTTKEKYDITLTVDGAISSVTTVTLKDFTNARLVSNYNQKHEAPYYRYIGNGEVTLNRLMKLSGDYIPYDSTIVIQASAGNNLWLPITSMNAFAMDCSGESVVPVYNEDGSRIIAWEFTGNNWEDVTLNLSKGDPNVALRIKITPISATESEDNTIVLELKYVNAKNVDSVSGLSAAATENVVLMSNLDITSNATKITVGDGVTFYGNGFIINATTYKAEKTGSTNTKIKYSYEQSTYCYNCGKDLGFGGSILCTLRKHNMKNITVEKTSSDGTYAAYYTNQALITLNGGNIDNIYINGPVYPELQYYADDSNNGANTVSTGYYVSGIKVTTTGNINNSYVSGFRQPISAQGTALTVNNTTLEGGNYANLQLVAGSLSLENVTTIQDPNGMESTVDTIGKPVIGLGVAVESGALQSNINITGYLNQYNWVPENTDATLPTISGINLDTIFGYAFNGVMGMKISRFLEFIHLDETGEKYFNAGFIFANIGSTDAIDQLSNLKTPNETGRDYVDANGFTTGSALGKIEVRLTELTGTTAIDSMVSSMFSNADGLVYIYTYKDGRVWDYSDDTVDEEATAQKYVVTLSDDEGSVHPITYKGYYTDYGK